MTDNSNDSAQKFAVEVEDLTVAYREKPVLWDVDLHVPTGVLQAIIGPNGAGKTTLIKSVLGLVKPSAGRILVHGKPYLQQRQLVAYVPQRGSVDWDFPTNVLDVVLMGRYGILGWFKRPAKQDIQLANEALEKVGMEDYKTRQISQLSGGQQQRVAIARALANDPAIILADEPTGNLDLQTGQEIIDLLHGLNKTQRLTLIAATHDLKMIKASDRNVWMRDGKIERIERG